MRAMLLEKIGEPLSCRDVPIPKPGPGQVLIRVSACAGIHMSDIPTFSYRVLWEERSIKSVANLTRQDGLEFLQLAPRVPVRTEVQLYELEEANQALEDLRNGKVQGAAVLKIS
jgi:propanol-preferring alcohol dehydrogenase